MTEYQSLWDLDSIFSNDSEYNAFILFADDLKSNLDELSKSIDTMINQETSLIPSIVNVIESFQEITGKLGIAQGFITCLDIKEPNNNLQSFKSILSNINSNYFSISLYLNYFLSSIPLNEWTVILKHPSIKPIAFALEKKRNQGLLYNNPQVELTIKSLEPNGFHNWEQMYHRLMNKTRKGVRFRKNSYNNFNLSEIRENKKQDFHEMNRTLQKNEELFAVIINSITGFRLTKYKKQNYKSELSESLIEINNMKKSTLDSMFKTIDKNKEKLLKFIKIKAKLLQLDKLSWFDLYSPITDSPNKLNFTDGANIILNSVRKYDEAIYKYLKESFENGWIETKNSKNNINGASSINFALFNQFRLYLNFQNNTEDIITLAHELGHSYHYYLVSDLPILSQDYSLCIAESASTFFEQMVFDNLINSTNNDLQKISLLNLKLQNNVIFLLDIYSRFKFEHQLYNLRKNGFVDSSQLNILMLNSQKEAFNNLLLEYNQYAWITQKHFYKTWVPFYNYPYAFGCLFSYFLFSKAKKDATFINKFKHLLRDTGQMSLELLLKSHFSSELSEVDFWQSSIDLILEDINEFEKLSYNLLK